ncbi:phage tail spike protein [Ruthenibacterium lactatiformans]|uniref:phage tail spike protein n=1 Tax=Ruthenibacterium lactatiformans TaxID=1550024 RepID=UPI001968120D|nr:phage tail spike protein [Ruthenibacterium lactatiformans]MBN2995856.1 phage tail protein [Ruthenibacterium lactatiformans]
MKPILFPSTATEFTTQGLGALSDAISCIVTEERNGLYELEMQYPQSGIHFSEIQNRCIIYAIPSPYREAQPFRVYRITRPINGIATIYAQHISYDLAGIPVNPFTAGSAAEALSGMASHAAVESPFSFWTDKSTTANFSVLVPSASRSVLGGVEGSILDVYGGEYLFDKFLVRLYNQRGNDNGVVIRYGKNLTDVEQDANISSVATGVLPYWVGAEGELVQGNIVNVDGTFDFVRIMTIDFSSDFENQPTASELETRAMQYIKSNKIGVPSVSISVSFVQLEQTEEYKDLALLEKCDLCDTVTVQFEALGINAKSEIVRIITDVLLERYESVEVGDIRSNIAYTIADQQQKIEKAPTTSAMQKAINNATNWLTGADGYVIAVKDDNGTWKEILFLDTPSAETAKNVLRINTNGIGFSTNGVNGPYRNAWTIDGSLVADFITTGTLNAALAKIINIDATNINTGTLNADLIKAGTINSTSGNVSLNLDFGIQEWRSDFNGQEIEVAISSGMLSFRKVNSDGTRETYGYITTTGNSSGKLASSLNVSSGIFSNGVTTEAINSKAVSWTYSNELGKYVLTGT